MGRFENLEFDKPESKPAGGGNPSPEGRDYLKEAQTAFENGRFRDALRLFGKVIEHKPAAAEGWLGQVRALVESDSLAEAAQWADKALDKFPNDPAVLSAKAVVCARLGDGEGGSCFFRLGHRRREFLARHLAGARGSAAGET